MKHLQNFPLRMGGVIISIHLVLTVLILSCCTTNNTNKNDKLFSKPEEKKFKITCRPENQPVRLGSSFDISISSVKKIVPDSVLGLLNNTPFNIKQKDDFNYSCQADIKKSGRQNITFTIKYSDSLTEQHNLTILFLPSEAPKIYSYKILRKFKHDVKAYTQGLIYVNNVLFESTGQQNESTIRKVNPRTGDVILKKPMDSEIFGEGIALIGDKIYMLTYVSHIGFVFDTTNFELIRKFGLQTREGWGLTSNNGQLIMSDGTSYVYFLDPEYTTIQAQVEVCDNNEFIDSINELEDTPYGLFANVYGEDYVIIIDKSTGVVTGKIDFSGIFPEGIPKDMDHVLNGIAYNEHTKTFYVTGKYWPLMYEIKINVN